MGAFSQPLVMDREAYETKLKQFTDALGPNAPPSRIDDARHRAVDYAYKTEFSLICTAAIRGDWEPAKERCRQERAEKGEDVAREVMRSYQRAVRRRKLELGT